MNLNYRKIGSGHPLLILHGLYGSGDNWLTIGRYLSGFCEVYLLDLRNHGDSPHSDEHNSEVLMSDIKGFVDFHGIDKFMMLFVIVVGSVRLANGKYWGPPSPGSDDTSYLYSGEIHARNLFSI